MPAVKHMAADLIPAPRASEHDKELALYALRGILDALDALVDGRVQPSLDDPDGRRMRTELILAGRLIAGDIAERF